MMLERLEDEAYGAGSFDELHLERIGLCLSTGSKLYEKAAAGTLVGTMGGSGTTRGGYDKSLAQALSHAIEKEGSLDPFAFPNQIARAWQVEHVHRALMSVVLHAESGPSVGRLGSLAMRELSGAIERLLGLDAKDVRVLPTNHGLAKAIVPYIGGLLAHAESTLEWAAHAGVDPYVPEDWSKGFESEIPVSDEPEPTLCFTVALRLKNSDVAKLRHKIGYKLPEHGLAFALRNGFFATAAQMAAAMACESCLPEEAFPCQEAELEDEMAPGYAARYSNVGEYPAESMFNDPELDQWTFEMEADLNVGAGRVRRVEAITFGPLASQALHVFKTDDPEFFRIAV